LLVETRNYKHVVWGRSTTGILMTRDPVSDINSDRIPAGHKRSPGGRANCAGGVGRGKAKAFRCQAINMRGFHQFIPITMEVGIPQVIHHDEEDVGMPLLLTAGVQKRHQQKE
jgi:hypothetical protein